MATKSEKDYFSKPNFIAADLREYKTWKEELNAYYNDLLNDFKEQMQDAYLQAKQTQLPDYKIFMAIAEEIGYDATGKTIITNELTIIAKELESFINQIEEGKI